MAPSHSTLDFKCALITGGGGGIGKALATYLISQGKKVLIAGRTESNLSSTASEIKAAGYYVVDTGEVASLPAFAKKLTAEHPELDCIINNAGVQRPLEVGKLSADDFLAKADQELDINIRGPMHLTLHLLPHLRSKTHAVVMNVSSVLGFVPFSVINPVYNGTKAWVHMWSTNLRSQLQESSVRVVEIVPPSVETDLHRERADPDDNKKHKGASALSIDEFMAEVVAGWKADSDTISAGPGVDIVKRWDDSFGAQYKKMTGQQ